MATDDHDRSQGLFTWQGSGLPDYAPIGRRLPLLENIVVQVRPGPFVTGAKIVSGGGATVIRSVVKPHSVGVIVLDPSMVGFLVPLRWADGLRIDGVIHSEQDLAIEIVVHIDARTSDARESVVGLFTQQLATEEDGPIWISRISHLSRRKRIASIRVIEKIEARSRPKDGRQDTSVPPQNALNLIMTA